MRKLLSMALVLAMSLTIAAPTFAAGVSSPTGSNGDYMIMPCVSLYSNSDLSDSSGTLRSVDFTATPSNGNYICIWFENTTDEYVSVILHRYDTMFGLLPVLAFSVPAHSGKSQVYYNKTAGSGTYYLTVEATEAGGLIAGTITASQYSCNPNA